MSETKFLPETPVTVAGIIYGVVETHLTFKGQSSYQVRYETGPGETFWVIVPEYIVKESKVN